MRVQRNRAYLIIVLLSRVISKFRQLNEVNTGVIENMFASDLRFLEEMYNRINEDDATVQVTCPECNATFEKEFGRLGNIKLYPLESIFKEVAFVTYHFHWPKEQILDMSHRERHSWVKEINRINDRINTSR